MAIFRDQRHLDPSPTDNFNPTFELTTGLFGPVETKHNAQHFLGAEYGSNNTGELTAICEALKWIIANEELNQVALYYDSKYAAKITTGEYTAQSNKYLAAKARTLVQQARNTRNIRFEHIKGHSEDIGNDAADELANKGAKGQSCRNIEEWNIIKHTHPEKPEPKANTPTRNNNRPQRVTTHTTSTDEIRIPLPSYGYGSTRRARFAFGRITPTQARTNTANQFRTQDESIETSIAEEEPPEEPETAEPYNEPEEEDIFAGDENPTANDRA